MRKVMYMIMLIVVSISFDSCTNVSEKQSSRDLNCNQEVKSEYELERERLDSIIKDLMKKANITEELKAQDQMKWVQMMNNLKETAEEITIQELIYN